MKNSMIFGLACAALLTAGSAVAQRSDDANPNSITVTGKVTCAHCLDLSQHKGFTPWTWATHEVGQGDAIVLSSSARTYYLQGDRKELSAYLEDQAVVRGYMPNDPPAFPTDDQTAIRSMNTLVVTNIVRPVKAKNHNND